MRVVPWLCLLLSACNGSSYDLLVDLNTDLRPRLDFEHVRTSIVEAPSASLVGTQDDFVPAIDDDFLTFPGRRIAELFGNPAGDYLVRVRLLDGEGADVASRDVRVALGASRVIRVRITSDCLGVSCPGGGDAPDATECLGGRCVPPDCTLDDVDLCGTPGCTSDAQCTAPVDCADTRCEMGECLAAPVDTRCATGEYCDVVEGCTQLPEPPRDAGVVVDAGGTGFDAGGPGFDAGLDAGVDGGPTCVPALCDDGDPCTDDGCSGGACVNTPRCGATEYCRLGVCQPDPTFRLETPSAGGCADLGVGHPGGSDFLFRRTVTGRPNADAPQFNQQVSCGTPVEAAAVHRLDSAGREMSSFYSAAVTNCYDGILGRWNAWVEVDGQRSNVEEVTYYNSRCANVRTCSLARSYCSPCRSCDFGSNYCYLGTTCTPNPTLAISTSNGPGCVDLGVTHISPPALTVTITGRANSTSTQLNEHVSCGEAEMAAEMRTLDSSGRVVDPLTTGTLACDSTIYGRWNVTAEIDGERSNTVSVTYYNSTCPGIDTCSRAAGYCAP
ncbi:MAG: hypothetical protein H6719_35830 [Sandaracinaceae bacterium]|nr:hypothetical protein [Sandaracinaceae bacterium]